VAVTLVGLTAAGVGYLVGMVALLAVIAFGLLGQRRWGWGLAVVMGFIWLLSGVIGFINIVTSPLLWASPLLTPLVGCYVVSLIAALVLLVTPAGRAPFHQTPAPPAP